MFLIQAFLVLAKAAPHHAARVPLDLRDFIQQQAWCALVSLQSEQVALPVAARD